MTDSKDEMDRMHPLFSPIKPAQNKSPLKLDWPPSQSPRQPPPPPPPETSAPSLGDPIKLSPSTASSSINFDQITQLPTPVIDDETCGQFQNFTPNAIDLPKRSHTLTRHSPTKARVISEYRPMSVSARANSLTSSPKRIISNPLISAPSSVSPPTVPSQPSKYTHHIFHAIHTDKYYKFQQQVGSGNFSTVVLAVNVNQENDRVAVKIVSIPPTNKTEIDNFKSYIKREISILRQIRHPCLIHLIDYNLNFSANFSLEDEEDLETPPEISQSEVDTLESQNDQQLFLIYCPGGNLFEFSTTFSKLNYYTNINYWKILKRVVCEVIIGIAYLHHKNIVHRDIKLENILLNYNFSDLCEVVNSPRLSSNLNICCVSDFGLSKKLPHADQLLSTRCGSQDYIAPEILMGVKYNGKLTDSWSVGVLVYSLIENRLPFDLPPLDLLTNSGVSPSVIKRRRSRNNPAHRIAMIDWEWVSVANLDPEGCQFVPEVKSIISDLKRVADVLLVRKDKRVTIGDLIESPEFAWIKQSLPSEFYEF